MSHISRIELEVKDLGALQVACDRLGFTFLRGQTTYKWYGREDGRCDHAIKVPNALYEIGIIKNGDRYDLQCDYYDRTLVQAIGESGGLLKQAYGVEKTKVEARRKGYSVIEQPTETGIRLHVRVS